MKQAGLFSSKIYCMDTDILIELQRHYPSKHIFSGHDLFPAIWQKIENMVRNGSLISHIEVFREIEIEIEIGGDKLYKWCKKHKKMFKNIDECQIRKIEQIKQKYNKDYWDRKIAKLGRPMAHRACDL